MRLWFHATGLTKTLDLLGQKEKNQILLEMKRDWSE
jgi:hypothetical protein